MFHPPAFPSRKMPRFVLLLETACVGGVHSECGMHLPRPPRLFVHILRSNMELTMSPRGAEIIDAVREMDTCTLANAALDRLRIHGGPECRASEAGPIDRLVVSDHHKVRQPSYRVVPSLFVFFPYLSWSPLAPYFDWHNTFFLKTITRIAGVLALIFPPFGCRVCSPQDVTGSPVDSTWTRSRKR